MTRGTRDLLDGTRPVREGEELDLEKLGSYISSRVPELPGPLVLEQFGKGHSNLTYLLRSGEEELVLRRPPFGAKIKTAHDMGREYRILSGLEGAYASAPRPVLHCDDESIIGAPFYLMERVRGVILRGGRKPPAELGITPEVMRALSTSLIDGLVELHSIDVHEVGFGDLGRPVGYVERQVRGWTSRYFNAKTDEVREVEEAARWLAENMPEESGAALIHGDYKYDNLVLDPEDLPRIVAVLDWEMATVGDPLMDLGCSLGYWVDPDDASDVRQLPLGPTLLEGNLDRQRLVERYRGLSGLAIEHEVFYYVYGLFKVAVIAQQIYKRFKQGFTKDPRFAMMIMGVKILGKQALRAIERNRISGLG